MAVLRITELDIDDGNFTHLCKHGVSIDEIEQCLWNTKTIRVKPGHKDRYYLYGRTDGGRYLFVVFVYLGHGVARPISARDMDAAERRTYAKP